MIVNETAKLEKPPHLAQQLLRVPQLVKPLHVVLVLLVSARCHALLPALVESSKLRYGHRTTNPQEAQSLRAKVPCVPQNSRFRRAES